MNHPPPERAEWPEFRFMGLKMADENDNLAEVSASATLSVEEMMANTY